MKLSVVGQLRHWQDIGFNFLVLEKLQKNVSPGDMNTIATNVMQPSREEKYLEMAKVAPYIFHPKETLTNFLGNSFIWSAEDEDIASVGNNSSEKLKLSGHSPILNGKGIYNHLRNLPELSMPTREGVHDLKTMIMPENAIDLKLNDLRTTISCPSELEWIGGDMRMWFLRTANSHCLESLANFCENNVFIFDPGGGCLPNTNSKGVIIMLTEEIRQEVTLNDVLILISVCGQIGQLQDIICWKLTIDQLMMEHRLRKRVIMVQMVTAYRIQGVGHQTDGVSEINQQNVDIVTDGMKVIPMYSAMRQVNPEMDRIMRLEDQETSRKSVQITIFDPGGYLICVYEVRLVGGTDGTLYDQKLLQEVFTAEKFLLKGQEGIVVNVLITMYVLHVERSLEVREPPRGHGGF